MRPSKRLSKSSLVSLAIGLSVITCAAYAEGDAAKGQQKAVGCAGCHGPAGEGLGTNPKLAGLDPTYFVEQLKKFKSGERDNAMMKMTAQNLSDDDMANLAAYYASKGEN